MSAADEIDERIRFKVPGFDGASEVYRFDDPIPGMDEVIEPTGEDLKPEEAEREIREAKEAADSGRSEMAQTAPFDKILSDVDEESGTEKYAGIFEEDEISQADIDALVREELAKRGLLREHTGIIEEDEAAEGADEAGEDIYLGDLVSDNDPLIAKLEEEARKLREEESAREEKNLSWKELREQRAAEKRAEAERRAAEKAAAKAAEKRGAESQIEAERRMIAEHREAEAQARKVVERRIARRRKRAIKAEKRRARGRGPLSFIVKLLTALLVAAMALTLMLITLGMLGKSEMINTKITDTHFAMPDGINGEVLTERSIRYNGKTYEYSSSRANLLVLWINPEAKEGRTLDSVLLLSLDTSTGKSSLISIPGGTICEADSYTAGGSYEGIKTVTLDMTYSMGGSGKLGAENAAAAVSRILGGIPVNAYLALDIRSMGNLADAVGGIEVVSTNEFAKAYREFKGGESLMLTGGLGEMYVSSIVFDSAKEYESAEVASDRLERQKLFGLGFLRSAIRDTRNNPLFPIHLARFMKPYSSSNLTLTREIYLLSALLRKGYDEESAFTIPGNAEKREGRVRYRVKPKKLYAQVVRTFFEEEQ